MRWSPWRGQRSQISASWRNERKRQTLIECGDVVRRWCGMGEKKVLTPDFNNERSEAQQSERSSPWKWVIERLARATVSSGRLTFAYKDKWVTQWCWEWVIFPIFRKVYLWNWRRIYNRSGARVCGSWSMSFQASELRTGKMCCWSASEDAAPR